MASGDLQELAHAAEKVRKAIVVGPVPGALDGQDARVAEGTGTAVGLGIDSHVADLAADGRLHVGFGKDQPFGPAAR